MGITDWGALIFLIGGLVIVLLVFLAGLTVGYLLGKRSATKKTLK